MWLLGALGSVRKLAGSVFSLMRAYPLQAAIIALVCLSAWLWHGKNGALKERDAAIAQTAQILAASKEAEKRAFDERKAQEKQSKENADATDKKHKVELADATSRASRYISLHQVRKCAASPTAPASQDHGTESGIGPGSEAIMVAVTEADIHICTDNTTRLEAVRDWAAGLSEVAR